MKPYLILLALVLPLPYAVDAVWVYNNQMEIE